MSGKVGNCKYMKNYFVHKVLVIILICFSSSFAEKNTRPLDYDVKAAFLYYFTEFVEWPEMSDTPVYDSLRIGILGTYPFKNYLKKIIKGKSGGKRQILVKYTDDIEQLKLCDIVFIPPRDTEDLKLVLDELADHNILTVGDQTDFAKTGGIIGFILQDNKVRFEINMEAAKKADLKLSSRLLKLATIIENGD
jgi:YfiR/HmsC-like